MSITEGKRRTTELDDNNPHPPGVRWRWLLGSYLQGQRHETYNSKAVDVYLGLSLFADGKTVLGTSVELEERMQKIKEVVASFVESNNKTRRIDWILSAKKEKM